jgi:hypothetical protein
MFLVYTERCLLHAGYGWQIGWYFEVAWQVFFAVDLQPTLWVCMFLLLGAFLGFSVTLLSLFRCGPCLSIYATRPCCGQIIGGCGIALVVYRMKCSRKQVLQSAAHSMSALACSCST